MIRVSIVEDDTKFAEMLAWALSQYKDIEIGQKYTSCEEALCGIPEESPSPDVILLDINLPGITGIECLRELKALKPRLKARIVVLTGDPRVELVFDALKLGADGYLTKNEALMELWKHIVAVTSGGGAMSPDIVRIVMQKHQGQTGATSDQHPGLSPQEENVFRLLAQGKQYKEMADQLHISINTVRKHLQRIYRKLDVRTRHDATRLFGREDQ
jgi:DNA-binding NarL/FixJ family response regulator